MTGTRTYGDPCGLAKALDAIGERWALLIMRELAFGPRRFTDLRAALSASPNVLSQRLDELEQAGVVERRSAGGAQYDLSDWGRALHPVLVQLSAWGTRAPTRPTGEPSTRALIITLEARFRPDRAAGLSATCELRVGDEVFSISINRKMMTVVSARLPGPDLILTTDQPTLAAALSDVGDLGTLALNLVGDAKLGQAFLGVFARP